MIELYKGEKRLIGMLVSRRKLEDFQIESVSCNVLDNNKNVLTSGSGDVVDKEVYYLFDTTQEEIQKNRIYFVEFHVIIQGMPKIIIDQVQVKIK